MQEVLKTPSLALDVLAKRAGVKLGVLPGN
jgi:hypothetical protein